MTVVTIVANDGSKAPFEFSYTVEGLTELEVMRVSGEIYKFIGANLGAGRDVSAVIYIRRVRNITYSKNSEGLAIDPVEHWTLGSVSFAGLATPAGEGDEKIGELTVSCWEAA